MVVATERHVACEVTGEAVVLHLDQGVYYGLNAVGARIWQLVQTPQIIGAIVTQLQSEFDVEHERCVQDVRELVADLAAAELVSIAEESSA